jgi:carboxymethylenebutenolidase
MYMWSNANSNRRQLAARAVRMTLVTLASVAAPAVIFVALLSTQQSAAQAAQSQPAVELQSIKYPSGGAMIDAYLARPRGASKSPAVIVVHDNLGANQTFQALTRQFAAAGFVALAPHLPSRSAIPAAEPAAGRPPQRTPVTGLNFTQATQDLAAAFAFLGQDGGVDAAKISAVGVGWGGFAVWKLAEQTPKLYRAVVYYAGTPADDDRLRAINAHILGHYAEQDYLATARVLKTKQLLGPKFTYYIYPTVPGFVGGGTGEVQPVTEEVEANSLGGSSPAAVAAAAKQTWTRTLAFLRGPE